MYGLKGLACALICGLLLAAGVCAQRKDEQAAQTNELQETAQMNEKVVRLYAEKSYDEALSLARRVLEIRDKVLSPDDKLVIEALNNLVEIYIAKNMYKEAEPIYQRLLAHYEKPDAAEPQKMAKVLERLAYISFRREKYDDAEKRMLRAISVYESMPERDAKQLASLTLQLAELYYSKGDNKKAEAAYLRAIEFTDQIKEPTDSEKDNESASDIAVERYICFIYQTRKPDEAKKIEKEFTEKRMAEWRDKHPKASEGKVIKGGVINGRAISMPKPVPPLKVGAVYGVVRVRITINEQGEVVKAKATCGPESLRESAERAAMSARFTPTLLSGAPVKVTGVINYNFGK